MYSYLQFSRVRKLVLVNVIFRERGFGIARVRVLVLVRVVVCALVLHNYITFLFEIVRLRVSRWCTYVHFDEHVYFSLYSCAYSYLHVNLYFERALVCVVVFLCK